MATEPIPPAFSLDIREHIARIDRTQAEIDKWRVEMAKTQADTVKTVQETRFAPLALAFTGLGAGAGAALFAAGVAFAKLILG